MSSKENKKWFSPSFLKTFKSCPYRAMYEPFTESPYLQFGNLVHDLLAEFATGRIPDVDRQDLKDKFLPKVVEEMKSMKFSEKFQKIMNNFGVNKNFTFDNYEIFDVESENCPEEYSQTLHNSRMLKVPMFWDGKGMRGKIDIILNTPTHYRIIDYKTGSTEYDEFQILCYAVMVCFTYNLDPTKVKIDGEFWYLEKGTKTVFPITVPKLVDFYDELCFLKNSYETKIYMKKPSWDTCRMCHCDCQEGQRMQTFKNRK